MAVPTNRNDFKNYCLRKLGEPVIQVNVAVEQIDDRIDEALYKFYERNYQSVEEFFLLYDITTPEAITDSNGDAVLDSNGDATYTTGTDTEAGYIAMPSDTIAVTDVFRPALSAGVYSTEFQFHMNELYSVLRPSNLGGGGISYYYMHMSQMELLNRFMNPERQYDYNQVSQKLILAGGLKDADNKYGGVVIRGYRKIHGETDDSNITTYNIWQLKWLQDYACALIKLQWGQNLSKYQSVQLVGGVQINGQEMIQEAKAEIEKLEEQLQLEYEKPIDFLIG